MATQRHSSLPHYMVSVYEDPDVAGALRITFVPKSSTTSVPGDSNGRPPQHIVSVKRDGEVVWTNPPAQAATLNRLNAMARERIRLRYDWLDRLNKLIVSVRGWAEELGWATRIVNKRLDDHEIGNYAAPGLLLQKETLRLFLEPVSRAAPGSEGMVDLYLMPSYDDIASLHFYNNRWNVHYLFGQDLSVSRGREEEALPLSKSTLRKVLDEMKSHAG